jgi:chemotaxis protein methyltransferase CheR
MTAGPDVPVAASEANAEELEAILDVAQRCYHYDFSGYAKGTLARRAGQAAARLRCDSLAALRTRVLADSGAFATLLEHLTVPVTEMFRDPAFFREVREAVVPFLATYSSVKAWVAGCSTGEEAYSLAILLAEEGLLGRSLIYATDINPRSLRAAEAGVYRAERIPVYSANYRLAGGRASLSDYYGAAYRDVRFDAALRERIVFSDHSLVSDGVFSEVHLVFCRNVLIYFGRDLQSRAIRLFRESLTRRGFLGLGTRETILLSSHASAFEPFRPAHKLYRLR